jgi:hypothetical protein
MWDEIKPASPLFKLPLRVSHWGSLVDADGVKMAEVLGPWPGGLVEPRANALKDAANNHARLQARVSELEAAVRKAAELAWDASGEGFNGEYTPKSVTPKYIDAMLDDIARQALNPEARS